jgi:hypothetical protein
MDHADVYLLAGLERAQGHARRMPALQADEMMLLERSSAAARPDGQSAMQAKVSQLRQASVDLFEQFSGVCREAVSGLNE